MSTKRKIMGLVLAFGVLAPAVLVLSSCKTPSDAEVKGSMEILDIDTKWVAKEYSQWPRPKLTLVPTVSFKIKNVSSEPLRFVNFNAIFKERDAVENLGDNFLAAIRQEAVPPGGLSPVITLKSNFGVEGRNLDDFKNNPQWRTYFVKIYAQFKGSRLVLLGEWPVSRTIDFKADQPVHMGGEKKEKK